MQGPISDRAGGISRRQLLLRAGALGCSAAASPLITPMVFAAAPWDARLVVIILRGGMDGLDVVQPVGDPGLAALRGQSLGYGEAVGALPLDGFFALHPGLGALMPLWEAGELAFAHAVSTPYRDRRSHFDGQDLLEAGTGFAPGDAVRRDGWLNRMLQTVPGLAAQTAFAIGREDLLILSGPAPVSNWAPETRLSLSPQAQRLLELVYDGDPVFRAAVLEAIDLTAAIEAAEAAREAEGADADMMAMQTMTPVGGDGAHMRLARFAVERLREETRVAAFSLNGWDTHNQQYRGMSGALSQLSDTVQALRLGLGPIWEKTAVIAMTEFGRTARENGTRGTDHGTGGAMLMAGGAVRGGRVYSDWPGLAEADLYDRRDLMPTADVRAYAASAMRGLFGLERGALESAVFPGLDMGSVPGVIL